MRALGTTSGVTSGAVAGPRKGKRAVWMDDGEGDPRIGRCACFQTTLDAVEHGSRAAVAGQDCGVDLADDSAWTRGQSAAVCGRHTGSITCNDAASGCGRIGNY